MTSMMELLLPRHWLVAVSWASLMWLGASGWGAGIYYTVPALLLFGDSAVDVGNNNFLDSRLRSAFLPYGRDFATNEPTRRFTNGRMVADFVGVKSLLVTALYAATRLGLPMPLPYLHPNATGQNFVKGINFASSGSGYLNSISSFLKVAPAMKKLQLFEGYKVKVAGVVGDDKAASIVSDTLYFVSAGSNDSNVNYFVNPVLQSRYSTAEFNSSLVVRKGNFVKVVNWVFTWPKA